MKITFTYCQIFICLLLFAKCVSSNRENSKLFLDTVALITERDLIPEGIAYDPKRNQIFISSMYKRKVVVIEENGKFIDFVETGADGLWSVFGMQVDTITDNLWIISTKGKAIPTVPAIADDRWRSKLYCYDLNSRKLLGSYEVHSNDTSELGFNDLAIANNGDLYITESITDKVFTLKKGCREIEEFLNLNQFTFLNGITLSKDSKMLFVSCEEGLLKIDLATKNHIVLKSEFTILPQPIDGLAFFENSLIAHQGALIRRLYLNSKMDSIVWHEVLDDKNLNSSTAGEIGKDGWYYYIANSQIKSGVDYKIKKVKPLDSLQNILIKRLDLSEHN